MREHKKTHDDYNFKGIFCALYKREEKGWKTLCFLALKKKIKDGRATSKYTLPT